MLTIKSKSTIEFIERHAILSDENRDPRSPKASVYNHFKDEIYLRKQDLPPEITPGQHIKFILDDKGAYSLNTIFNGYIYAINHYDDHCYLLTLERFKVLNDENEKF